MNSTTNPGWHRPESVKIIYVLLPLILKVAGLGFIKEAQSCSLSLDPKLKDTLSLKEPFNEAKKGTTASQVRILWWNTLRGGESSEKYALDQKISQRPVDQNLRCLTERRDRPNILILGEWFHRVSNQKLISELKTRYRYFESIPYLATQDLSKQQNFLVFSDYPFVFRRIKISTGTPKSMLFWNEVFRAGGQPLEELDRYLVHLEVILAADKRIQIFPIHTVQPWRSLKIYEEKVLKWPEFIARAHVGKKIAIGLNNPLAHSLSSISDTIAKIAKEKLKSHKLTHHWIALGDFNQPLYLKHVKVRSFANDFYDRLFPFGYLIPYDSKPYTWPATLKEVSINSDQAQSKISEEMGLDLFFVGEQTKVIDRRVLPLLGSDHFPIDILFSVEALQKRMEEQQFLGL